MATTLLKNVAVGYNGNQLTQISKTSDKYLINIDYLIINLIQLPKNNKSENIFNDVNDIFEVVQLDYGTKTFKNRFEIYHNKTKIGTLLNTPHSKIINENLMQFQFENELFYTNSLNKLKSLTMKLTEFLNAKFESVNRLDIALDLENKNNFYQNVTQRILNNELIISGKNKKISAHYETNKGTPLLTGFTVGSRSNSRYLRIYNKSIEIAKNPKQYILETWKNRKFEIENVWRFEYQLNNDFFRFLTRVAKIHNETEPVKEVLTFGIFCEKSLFQLLRMATKNHFDIKYNTGKSQINKEKEFILINWDYLKTKIKTSISTIQKKTKHLFSSSTLSIKRMIKANYREYYKNEQNAISYIIAINNIIDDYDNELIKLKTWFLEKVKYYNIEFQKSSLKQYKFDKELFNNHLTYAI